jgi:periplasmic protein TonB
MNAMRDIVAVGRWPETLRWGACFALALSFHAAGAAALLAHWNSDSDLTANAPVIMIELAPVAVSPNITPTDAPPDTVLSKEAEPEPEPPKPIEKVEAPVAPQVELEMMPPTKPPERKAEKKPREKRASVNRTPNAAELKSEHAAAPAPGARGSNARANWNSQISARLERYKRAPSDAPGASGVVMLAFSVDSSGGVHNAHIMGGSGSSALDRETLALVRRAAPMPPPPPEVPPSERSFRVPIRYNMH